MFGRVLSRLGLALRAQKWTISMMLVFIVVSAVYFFGATKIQSMRFSKQDCADTAMAILADTSEAAAHAAYACFSGRMAAMPENYFVGQVVLGTPHPSTHRVAQDGNLVFFSDGDGVGYIVHLDSNGKVEEIE